MSHPSAPPTPIDFMRRALTLAAAQQGRTGKNPAVGCVIVSRTGCILGEGATADGGHPHAEAVALSHIVCGEPDTAYVTLEPCRERTDGSLSCSTRLLNAGIRRVICAARDEHPQGRGGLDRLAKAGVLVQAGLLEAEATALYADFFKVHRAGDA